MTILGKVKHLTEHQRSGDSKRRNLAEQLEQLSKATQEKKTEIAPTEEQSTDAGELKRKKEKMQEISAW